MKTLITSAFLAFITSVSFAQSSANTDNTYSAKGTTIKMDSTLVNFGEVQQGASQSKTVGFTNTGKRELIFSSCTAKTTELDVTCPAAAIRPGQSGAIKITYTASKLGKFSKAVDLVINTPDNGVTIKVKANVVPSAAPTVGAK